MEHDRIPMHFEPADLKPLSVEQVSIQLRVSCAFVRLCLACGCPTRNGRISAAGVLSWLFNHFPRFRTAAGLRPLAEPVAFTPEESRHLRMGNTLITLIEFSESRASDPRQKQRLAFSRKTLERLLNEE